MKLISIIQNTSIKLVLVIFIFIFSKLSWAVSLVDIQASMLDSTTVEMKLKFDADAPDPVVYKMDSPPQIYLDLPLVFNSIGSEDVSGFQYIKNIQIIEAKRRLRLVINLDKAMNIFTTKKKRELLLYIGKNKQNMKDMIHQPLQPKNSAKTDILSIEKVDFQRGKQEEGNVIISLSNKNVSLNTQVVDGKIRLEFKGSILPNHFQSRLDVVDFGTIVKFINLVERSGYSMVEIEVGKKFEYLVYQTDNIVTVSVKEANNEGNDKKILYTGDKLSLNFQDIKVREVLQLIADFMNLNLVASDTVTGNITLKLQDVPWDQALDIIMKVKGLDKRLEGDVLTVAPAEEMAKRELLELTNNQKLKELTPLLTELIHINYADATQVSKVLSGEKTKDSLITDRGSINIVARTNSLLIKETHDKIKEIKELIRKIDVPVRQVMIEARIVTIDSSYVKDLGIKWSGDLSMGLFNQPLKPFIDMGASSADQKPSSLTMGFSNNSKILNLELSAVLADGGGETISQPKVITADKKKAVIKSGQQIAYLEKSSNGATSVSFKDAVLSLEVIPQITPDGSIVMEVQVTNDSPGRALSDGNIPINKHEVKTEVLVKNGETVVLGGVFTQTKRKIISKVPFLGDLPIWGALFRSSKNTDQKKELMIFLTPRILKQF